MGDCAPCRQCRDLTAVAASELLVAQAARVTFEARCLQGRAALFPDGCPASPRRDKRDNQNRCPGTCPRRCVPLLLAGSSVRQTPWNASGAARFYAEAELN
jgi:hypothetical protein